MYLQDWNCIFITSQWIARVDPWYDTDIMCDVCLCIFFLFSFFTFQEDLCVILHVLAIYFYTSFTHSLLARVSMWMDWKKIILFFFEKQEMCSSALQNPHNRINPGFVCVCAYTVFFHCTIVNLVIGFELIKKFVYFFFYFLKKNIPTDFLVPQRNTEILTQKNEKIQFMTIWTQKKCLSLFLYFFFFSLLAMYSFCKQFIEPNKFISYVRKKYVRVLSVQHQSRNWMLHDIETVVIL